MAFDVPTILRMLGIDPKDILGKVEELQTVAKDFEARFAVIEEKQDHIVALLEALHDDNALRDAEKLEGLNGNRPNGATVYD
jgi:hypothetical protein